MYQIWITIKSLTKYHYQYCEKRFHILSLWTFINGISILFYLGQTLQKGSLRVMRHHHESLSYNKYTSFMIIQEYQMWNKRLLQLHNKQSSMKGLFSICIIASLCWFQIGATDKIWIESKYIVRIWKSNNKIKKKINMYTVHSENMIWLCMPWNYLENYAKKAFFLFITVIMMIFFFF